jgi:hypothetical protein
MHIHGNQTNLNGGNPYFAAAEKAAASNRVTVVRKKIIKKPAVSKKKGVPSRYFFWTNGWPPTSARLSATTNTPPLPWARILTWAKGLRRPEFVPRKEPRGFNPRRRTPVCAAFRSGHLHSPHGKNHQNRLALYDGVSPHGRPRLHNPRLAQPP